MNIIRIAIRNPVFTTMTMAALIVLGLFSYQRLAIDEYPDVSIPIVSVQTIYPGAGPEAIEREVSRPIEEAVNTIEGIDRVTSTSLEGVSVVVAEFDLDTDDNVAAQDVRSKLDQIRRELPAEIDPPVVEKFDPAAKPIVSLALFAKERSVLELTTFAEDVVKPRLETLGGVASAEVVGGTEREIRVTLLPSRLQGLGLGVADVMTALRRENLEVPVGSLTRGDVEELVRVAGRMESPADFAHVIVAVRDGSSVRLGDVATVADTTEEVRSVALVNGARAVAIDVRKVSGSNTVAVAEAVREALDGLREEIPAGVELGVVQDNSTFIENAVADVEIALLLGAMLTVIIVFLSLGDARATAITALALPVSVISAFIVIDALDFTLNTMTLMGLSLSIGILVDDAIVVIENIVRHRREGSPPREAAETATRELALAVTATTLTIVAVFVPVAFMEGLVGKFFYQFGITVAWAVLVSTFVSLTLTPMLSAHWLRSDEAKAANRKGVLSRAYRVVSRFEAALDRLGVAYRTWVAWALDHRKSTLGVATASFVGAMALFPFIGGEFMTSSDRGFFFVVFDAPAGASLVFTERKARELDARLRDLPGVSYTYATVGGGLEGSVEHGEILVKLVPRNERASSQAELMVVSRGALDPIHGVDVSVLESGKMGLVEKPVQLKVQGPDLARLEGLAERLIPILRDVPGAIEVESSLTGAKPEYQLRVRRDLAAEIGLTVGQVAAAVRPAVAGEDVTTWEAPDGESYDVVVRLAAGDRDSPADLERLPVTAVRRDPGTSGWVVVPLAQVAEIRPADGPTRIDRENLQRVVTVSANVAPDANLQSVSGEIRERIGAAEVPAGYSTRLAGETEDFEETAASVVAALVLSVILIYMILASQFGSFTQPLAIMMSLPLSLVGAFVALLLTDDTMNIMSMIGIILLMGLVTKNGILLVDFTNQRRRAGDPRREALIAAGGLRLRPILMTAFSTVFGVLPVALALGEGSEFRAPMARAVIGGMTTATLLTLIVIPVVYTYIDDLTAWLRRVFTRRGEAAKLVPRPTGGHLGLVLLLVFSASFVGEEASGREVAARGTRQVAVAVPVDSVGEETVVPFPGEKLFRPLMADPKEPRFVTSVLWSRSGERTTTLASVGMGETFGLVRWAGPGAGSVTQLNLSGGVFAQFDMETASFDLINADYLVGLALDTRRGWFAGRLKLYHQSSHLGDEFLLRTRPERVNLSYEALDLVLASELGRWRLYTGGEQTVRRDPETAPEGAIRGGAEYRQERPLFNVGEVGAVHFVAAAEARRLRGAGGGVGWSLRTGIEVAPLRAASKDRRSLSILVEVFDGPSPYGQFYDRDLRYIGLGGKVEF